MIYTPRIRKAMKVCVKAHFDQEDYGGYPYCHHPLHLAEQMESESEVIVALLHDVLEDCPEYTLERLVQVIGLSEEEREALVLITHEKSVPYMDYVRALAGNPIARKVKLADMAHNLDKSRMDGVTHPKFDTIKACYEYLLSFAGEAD